MTSFGEVSHNQVAFNRAAVRSIATAAKATYTHKEGAIAPIVHNVIAVRSSVVTVDPFSYNKAIVCIEPLREDVCIAPVVWFVQSGSHDHIRDTSHALEILITPAIGQAAAVAVTFDLSRPCITKAFVDVSLVSVVRVLARKEKHT
jgi:hypothetical protein